LIDVIQIKETYNTIDSGIYTICILLALDMFKN